MLKSNLKKIKIAIVGGGFYGCYLAKKISEKFKKKIEIQIFEKNKILINEAGKNNQYRLHLGFHYPRSTDTIKQTLKGSQVFKKEFKNFIKYPKKNIYLVHKKSLISFKSYIKIFKKFNIKFKKYDLKKIKFLKNLNQFSGAINTSEGVILFDKLNPYLIKLISKRCKIHLNKKIIKINSKKGEITDENNRIYKNYDLIINSTYTNPNLGLNKKYKIKYEIAGILKIKNPFRENIGITIMDGPFVSLYPRNNSESTLSSVKYTPLKKFINLKNFMKNSNLIKKNKKNFENRIIEDAKKYFNKSLKIKNKKLLIAPKVKILNDNKSQRITMIKNYYNTISLLCGKIDAAPLISNKIIKNIENNYLKKV